MESGSSDSNSSFEVCLSVSFRFHGRMSDCLLIYFPSYYLIQLSTLLPISELFTLLTLKKKSISVELN
jgi:hypothetical protein